MADDPLLIDGKFVPGDDTLDVINPATGQLLTRVARRASEAQLEVAIAALRRHSPVGQQPR
jgi:acyl-CoA reductase-like NAD-dependent aldehyde dehydrogenase